MCLALQRGVYSLSCPPHPALLSLVLVRSTGKGESRLPLRFYRCLWHPLSLPRDGEIWRLRSSRGLCEEESCWCPPGTGCHFCLSFR